MEKSKRLTYLQWVLLGALSLSALYMTWSISFFRKTVIFSDGISTCFSRLQKSYIAKMVGTINSDYLTKNFFKNTEECFSEAIFYMEDNLNTVLENALMSLNSLSTDVHWFHRILENTTQMTTEASGQISSISTHFNKLEKMKEQLITTLNNFQNSNAAQADKIKVFFLVLIGIFFLVVTSTLILRRRKPLNEKLLSPQKLKKRPSIKTEQIKQKNPPLPIKKKEKPSQSPKIKQVGPKLDRIPLESILTEVIGLHSSKIFGLGIKTDFNIDEGLKVYAMKETLEQTFYYLLSYFLNASPSPEFISISGGNTGKNISISIFSSEHQFDEDILNDPFKSKHPEFRIAKTFLEELQGTLTLKNTTKHDGNNVGATFQVTLKSARPKPPPKKRLAQIKKGKKRDIAKQISL